MFFLFFHNFRRYFCAIFDSQVLLHRFANFFLYLLVPMVVILLLEFGFESLLFEWVFWIWSLVVLLFFPLSSFSLFVHWVDTELREGRQQRGAHCLIPSSRALARRAALVRCVCGKRRHTQAANQVSGGAAIQVLGSQRRRRSPRGYASPALQICCPSPEGTTQTNKINQLITIGTTCAPWIMHIAGVT